MRAISAPPATLDDAISTFFSALEPTDNQSGLIAEKHKAVRERIEASALYKIENTLLYGSYERSSQIRPSDNDGWALDVDILVILDKSETDRYLNTWLGNNDLLNDTKKAMEGFQGLTIEEDAPAISIKWKGPPKIKAEITPAIRRRDGGFYIPTSTFIQSEWLVTNPIEDAALLAKANQLCNGQLKPFIKALKCWNRYYDNILPSFFIETLAYYFATTSKFRTFDYELKRFFKKLLEYNGKTVPPPSQIGENLTIDVDNHKSLIKQLIEIVDKAYDLDKDAEHVDAIKEMRRVFGSPFPLT